MYNSLTYPKKKRYTYFSFLLKNLFYYLIINMSTFIEKSVFFCPSNNCFYYQVGYLLYTFINIQSKIKIKAYCKIM